MPSDVYWIETGAPLRIAIMARPRAGDWLEDEIRHWKTQGVERVVSLLDREEVEDLGLGSEAFLCSEYGIEFTSFPIPDRGVPADREEALSLARSIANSGHTTAIHCRAGIGRSSVMAAAALAMAGVDPEIALEAIERARGLKVPDTELQRLWIMALDHQGGECAFGPRVATNL